MPQPYHYGFEPDEPEVPSNPLDSETILSAGIAAAASGAMGAMLLADACYLGLEKCRSAKAEEKLRALRGRAQAAWRDLIALVDRNERAGTGLDDTVYDAPEDEADRTPRDDEDEMRARLFASEVPMRTAGACHQVLHLSLKALGRCGVDGIEPIGTAAALAYSGVVGGVLAARCALAPVQDETVPEGRIARERAERLLRESEALRSQIMDRVRRHIP